MRPAVRVIKLGGSLLDWPELARAFQLWLAGESKMVDVVIAGGGPVVESVRQLDSVHSLAPKTAHWLSIQAMSITAGLVATLLPEAQLISSLEGISTLNDNAQRSHTGVWILDVDQVMRVDAARAEALPCSWEVTSDSIAARVATLVEARELVLLKSTLPYGPANRESWSRSGFVDVHFPFASKGLNVRTVNLRDAKFPQVLAAG